MSPCVACGRSTRSGLDLRLTVDMIPGVDCPQTLDSEFEIAICPECASRIAAGDRIVGRLHEEDHP